MWRWVDLSPRGYSTSKRANSRQRRWHAEGASVIFLWEARKERDGRWRGTWPVTIAMSLKSTCRTSMIFYFFRFSSFLLQNFAMLSATLGRWSYSAALWDLLFTPTVAERFVTTLISIHAAGTYAQRHEAGSVWRGEVFVWNVLTRRPLRNAPWCVWRARARTPRTAVIYGGEKLMLMFSRWKSIAGVQRERDSLWKQLRTLQSCQLLSLCWNCSSGRAALNTYREK